MDNHVLPQDHCDFLALRNLVLASHMQDLRETTHCRHYENFRCKKLMEMMGGVVSKVRELALFTGLSISVFITGRRD